ncbi:hypothetical protein PHYBOEH_004799 [Phytophthora boehmeriae]|uniref:Uncharacterized protein n=1 Tax=Phytophthora boehmeriae TaxID=109152 RepID=A0A8T1WQ84_9STRA|nr:hypothetical protein PHYBOEH_004799 [Phytophthora boehmeriae]
MHPQFPVGSSSSSYTEQSMTSGHGETEEEMQRMLQFLDASIITPPSANESSAQQAPQHQHSRAQPLQPQQQLTAEQLRELAAIHEAEGGSIYNELGEVIDLLGSLDANDTDPALLHHQDATFGAVLQQQQQQQQQQQRYSEMGTASIGGNTATGLTPTDFSRTPTTMTSTGVLVAVRRLALEESLAILEAVLQQMVERLEPAGFLGAYYVIP